MGAECNLGEDREKRKVIFFRQLYDLNLEDFLILFSILCVYMLCSCCINCFTLARKAKIYSQNKMCVIN